MDTPHFEEKDSASPLQLADACAFCIKRHHMKARDEERFYMPIFRRLIAVPVIDMQAVLEGRYEYDFGGELPPD